MENRKWHNKRFCHFNLIEVIKDQTVFPLNLTFKKKGKSAEKLSLVATSPLSLVSESHPLHFYIQNSRGANPLKVGNLFLFTNEKMFFEPEKQAIEAMQAEIAEMAAKIKAASFEPKRI